MRHKTKRLLDVATSYLEKHSLKEGIVSEPDEGTVAGINISKVRDGDSKECWKAADYLKSVLEATYRKY